jgi:hypothetical protein
MKSSSAVCALSGNKYFSVNACLWIKDKGKRPKDKTEESFPPKVYLACSYVGGNL